MQLHRRSRKSTLSSASTHRRSSRRSSSPSSASYLPSGASAGTTVTRAIDFTTDVAREVVNTLTTITGGIVSGANTVFSTAGNVTDQFGEMFDMYATQVFQGAGSVAKTVADQMGTVLRVIPVVGGGVAYLVESAGGGVYHVIVAVGGIGSSAVKRVGKIAKKSADLVVYTLTAGNSEIREVGDEVNDLVGRFAKGVTGRGGGRRVTRSGKSR